ncbi:hypothetical protein [Streptomyces sp. NRRL S-920]|uniref:hypothetical protein n=1 Tax=Streptomyces sp. NRRL S-920 TaxID=1463921 RepID=UPI00131C1284|nr:hypothetical protein [Streptomyces sp. NRRL S-920]
MDERMSHFDGSVSARYSRHPRRAQAPVHSLTQQWELALDARLGPCSTSPVRGLNDQLHVRQ